MGALILVLVLAAVVIAISLRRVGPDEGLVIERLGNVTRTAGPGWTVVLPILERGRRVDTAPRHRWAVVTTNTSDGANAHVRLEYVERIGEITDAAQIDGEVQVAVEERLREHVAGRTAEDLPAVGQTLDWPPDSFVPGVLVERAEVTVCEVQGIGAFNREVNRGT